MSTPPLSKKPSSGNFESSSEEKSNDRELAPGSKPKPETQQKARPRAGTWVSVSAPSQQGAEKASEPMLSPRRGDAAPIAAPSATAKGATARPPNTSSSQTTATMPGASVKPAPVSTSAVSGQVASNSKVYDKTKVSGDQIPDAIAGALRAGFKGFASVPDPTNPSKMKNVPVFNIPPKQIARLFVGLESNFGNERLTGSKMTLPLRDKFGIKNFRINDVTEIDEINFIDHILKPFIQKEFSKDEFEQVRGEVKDGFNRFASKGNEILLGTQEGKNVKERTIENLAFMTKFEPVISPLVGLICGSERKLGSSSLSKPFKEFLLEIDKSYSEWAEVQAKDVATNPIAAEMTGPNWTKAYALANVEKPASANPSEQEMSAYKDALAKKAKEAPEALLNLKRAALIGVTFNRALIENWTIKFNAESQNPDEVGQPWVKHRRLLNGSLGHYTSFKFDDFFIDVMVSQPVQPEGFDKYLVPFKKLADMKRNEEAGNAAKQGKNRKALERSPTVSGAEKGEKEKKRGITSFIQGMISPRKVVEQKNAATESATDRSGAGRLLGNATKPAKVLKSSEGKLLKGAEARKTQMERRARKEIKDYLKEIKLPAFDLGYTAHLNEVITQRVNYEEFQLAPAVFCMEQLLKYRDSLEDGGNKAPATLDQIEKALTQLVVIEKQAAEKEVRAQSVKAAPRLPSLDLSALKRSPIAEDSEQAETELSEATEKSDSTEVESEKSSEPEREKS